MKPFLIILLFPSLSFAFLKGIPYKETEICEKIREDYKEAQALYDKASADRDKELADRLCFCGDQPGTYIDKDGRPVYRNKTFNRLFRASEKLSKAYNDAEEYKCFKQSPACSESVKDISKVYEKMDVVSGLIKAVGNMKKYCK